jgi:hypothetical protein
MVVRFVPGVVAFSVGLTGVPVSEEVNGRASDCLAPNRTGTP